MNLHLLLRKHGFQTELRIDNAKHAWSYWSAAIRPALEWLSPRLDAGCKSASAKPAGQGS
jgi:S-formylglutathione hydrolase FrmB